MEAPAQPHAIGLASVTHPVSVTSTSASTSSSRASNLVGEIREVGVEEEDEDGFVEPLTISQMDFCLFNESDEESIF